MADAKIVRIATLKSVDEFRAHVASLQLDLPCDSEILMEKNSPLVWPVPGVTVNGKPLGNRFVVQPMEGWDAAVDGNVTEDVVRRWRRFGESGAKLIFGGEAMAVRADGRANPNQLIISESTKAGLARLRSALLDSHRERYGSSDEVVIGFQLTHSGRFCKPYEKTRFQPRPAYRHPLLDDRFGVTSDAQVWKDHELEQLVLDYARAARVAWEVGADFVDIKHCHGYLLHEFLGAFTRPGGYGGSFENRTRLLRDIVAAIRASGNKIDLAVRLSAFDMVPYRSDPALSTPGKLGPGIPADFGRWLPYRYGFGMNPENPAEPDLTEAFQFMQLCAQLGIKLLNITAGSPYYNPHIQRPAAYPPSDGYQPPEDPLVGVARQIGAVRTLKARAPAGMILIGSAYTYLQEYLPHVCQHVIRAGWTDMVGVGRMVLSYPNVFTDAIATGKVNLKQLCRTFSDCTTAPRNGLISGCYPLDKYYSSKPEYARLKEAKGRAA